MGSSLTHPLNTSETHDTLTDRQTAKAIAEATDMDFAPAYLAGYFGSAIAYAAAKYPNDPDLRRAAALFRAWQDRAYDAHATITGDTRNDVMAAMLDQAEQILDGAAR